MATYWCYIFFHQDDTDSFSEPLTNGDILQSCTPEINNASVNETGHIEIRHAVPVSQSVGVNNLDTTSLDMPTDVGDTSEDDEGKFVIKSNNTLQYCLLLFRLISRYIWGVVVDFFIVLYNILLYKESHCTDVFVCTCAHVILMLTDVADILPNILILCSLLQKYRAAAMII